MKVMRYPIKTAATLLLISPLLMAGEAIAAVYTYDFAGQFANSKWNADGSNAHRVPGGPVSGSFSIDTDTLSVTNVLISTEFYSLYGPQVMAANYNYVQGGAGNDLLGTNPQTSVQISGVPSLPVYVGLLTDLTGSTSLDRNGTTVYGSYISIMDRVAPGVFGVRAFRPRLSLFLEGVDFSSAAPTNPLIAASEAVWNINVGNGIAGYSGAQGWAFDIATTGGPGSTGRGGSVPAPGGVAIVLAGLLGMMVTRRSRGGSDRVIPG